MNENQNPNSLFFEDLDDALKLKPLENDDIADFFEKHLCTLNKIADKHAKEYEKTLKCVSQLRIKGDSLDSVRRDTIINNFADKFTCDESKKKEIKEICGSYILESELPTSPVFGLFLSKDNTITSLKARNYFAEFRFMSFCQDLCQLIVMNKSIGSFGEGKETILNLIVNVIQTICSLCKGMTVKFTENESLLIKVIIEETYVGRYPASDTQIINSFLDRNVENPIAQNAVEDLITNLYSLEVISIEGNNEDNMINLRERIYFKI